MDRRRFLKCVAGSAAATATLGGGYSLLESGWFHAVESRVEVGGLPAAFKGVRIAFLSDMHHGPWTGLKYIEQTVAAANALKPDLCVLGGDYCHNGPQFIDPCIDALGDLHAPLGTVSVLGNHDIWNGPRRTRRAMDRKKIQCLVNDGMWLERGGQKLFIAGVDDFVQSFPDLDEALDKLPAGENCILLSHNPDMVDETRHEPRVKLMLSGHTHGGQINFPLLGAPIIPSSTGGKYVQGLYELPHTKLFVSRGLGTVTPPIRFNCRPEINLIELA